MKNKKIVILLALTAVTFILGAIAIVTSMQLREKATVPVAPNVPESKPLAADAAPYICQDSFTVTPLACFNGACTNTDQCAAGLNCQAPDATKPNDKVCLNPTCPTKQNCTCNPSFECTSKAAYKGTATLNDNAEVNKGDVIKYVITAKNNGEVAVPTVTITDVLATGLEFVDSTDGCTSANRTVTCSVTSSTAVNATISKSFRVRVLNTAAAGTLSNTATVTPSVGNPTTCSRALTIPEDEAPVCNDTCTTNNDCPTDTVCSSGRCRNAECTAESDCTCPEEAAPVCNDTCTTNNDCPTDTICSSGRCRNASCTAEADCTCPNAAPQCDDTCSSTSDCPSGTTCSQGRCRNAECTAESDCTCPGAAPQCNDNCTSVNDCPSGTTCSQGRCRNASCTAESDCTCPGGSTPTPTPNTVTEYSDTPEETPTLPTAGTSLPTILFIATGTMLVLIGVLVVSL